MQSSPGKVTSTINVVLISDTEHHIKQAVQRALLEFGLLQGGSPGDICLDKTVRLIDGKENVRLSSVVLVLNATLFLEGIGEVVDVRHGQVDLRQYHDKHENFSHFHE